MAVTVRLRKPLPGFTLAVEWTLERGIGVIFGPSGAGKSMTLQLMAGLESPEEGEIRVGERIYYDSRRGIDLTPQQRRVGYLFQHYGLFPHLSVRANILFGRSGSARAETETEFQKLMELFEMESLERRMPDELSGGQRQRVALARALMRKPDVLLLDEPLAAIDLVLRRTIRAELKALQRRLGIPMIVITHDLGEALSLADQLILYDQGQVLQQGEPLAVITRPHSPRVAEMLGRPETLGATLRSISF